MAEYNFANNIDVKAIKPALRAYALGYAAATGPRLFGFLRLAVKRNVSLQDKLDLLYTILKTSTQINRFPTSCGVLVGGTTALPRLIYAVAQWLLRSIGQNFAFLKTAASIRRLRFVCTFLSAWVAFDLLNRDNGWARKRARSRGAKDIDTATLQSPNQHHLPPPITQLRYAGKTIDLTLFTLCRALDVAVITAWTRTRSRSWHPEHNTPRLATAVRKIADPWVFASSAAVIMWSWFYSPNRLPRAYNAWISEAADIDLRLIHVLRLCRQGDYVYGQDTGQSTQLAGLCRDLGLPVEYGDPSKTIPIPCELYHCGTGKSCEVHGVSRFVNSWKFAMELYLPLQLLTKFPNLNGRSLKSAFQGASQSSSFLAAFVALFYYSVCLARTRLGPKIFSSKTITPQMWDSGLCVLAGCLTCGWSILLEKPSRRQEIAFFVAPRALATLLPRVYDKKYQRREQIVFATCCTVILNAARDPQGRMVRGVFGRLLRSLLRE